VKITAAEAIVKTASVEVRVLTLSGKQVTLAVFRQLQEEDIFDCTGALPSLRGVPWGHVNYCPNGDKCRAPESYIRTEHLHVVWQLGEELRRARVDKGARRPVGWGDDDAPTAASRKAALILVAAMRREAVDVPRGTGGGLLVDLGGYRMELLRPDWRDQQEYALWMFAAEAHGAPAGIPPLADAEREWITAAKSCIDTRKKIAKFAEHSKMLYSNLAALPQLFIAV
jgi:hypothetical protein